jgi:hypothetical protein
MVTKLAAGGLMFLGFLQSGPCLGAEQFSLSAVEGAFAAIVPTRDGIVVAADNRSVAADAICDGVEKVAIPRQDLRVAVAFGGVTRATLTSGGPVARCDDVSVASRKLDFARVIQDYLDVATDASAIDLRILSQLCQDHALSFQKLSIASKTPFLEQRRGTVLLVIAIARYEPSSRISRVGMATLMVEKDDTISSAVISDQVFSRSSPAPLLLFGNITLLQDQVFGLRGSEYLDWEKLDAIDNRKVEELDHGTVVTALRTIFEAAARVAAETMKLPSVGGLVQYVLIGDAPRPQLIDRR